MKTKAISIVFILILLGLALTGCFELFQKTEDKTTYTSHPIKVRYTISYGYDIECDGTGKFNILYDCDIPEVLNGPPVSISELNPNFSNITLVNNPMKRWDINGSGTNSYQLGITAEVTAESFIVSDLTGADALTISEIKNQHYPIYSKYTNAQSNDTITFIDPNNVAIKTIAQNELDESHTNNSFIVAKNLFIWLKEETTYLKHIGNEHVQPANKTCEIETGDCDDLSFLYISLCRSVGIPARFIRGFTVEKNSNGVVEIVSHAWAEVFVGGGIGNNGWIPVECACSSDDIEIQINQNFGLESVSHLRLYVDDGSNESMKISLSDIKFGYSNNVISYTAVKKILSYEILESKELVVENNYRKYQ